MSGKLRISQDQVEYFDKLEEKLNITLTHGQRKWYCYQQSILGEKTKQEFPSTVEESFLASSDAYYFQQLVHDAYQDNRCLNYNIYDALESVYVAMDIGVNDLTVMTFFQVVHGEIRIIDYYADKDKGVEFYARFLLQDKNYLYNTIFLPHDAARRDNIIVENTYERDFKKHFNHTNVRIKVLPRTDKNINIQNTKLKFSRCVFNINKVKPLLDHVLKFRKKWSEQYGRYLDKEHEDINCDYADSLIYAMQAVTHIEALGDVSGALKKHRRAVESRG